MLAADIERALIEGMSSFPVIDCHEHLSPERERLAMETDLFMLFRGYCMYTLNLAGMSHDYAFTHIFDTRIPLAERWAETSPYWERSRHTSYARALLHSITGLYGIDDLNDDTYLAVDAAVRASNVPGLYRRVLDEACHIKAALTIPMGTVALPEPEPYLAYVLFMPFYFPGTFSRQGLITPPFAGDEAFATLDAYLTAFRRYLVAAKAAGMVGVKIASVENGVPDYAEAARLYGQVYDGAELPDVNPVRDYILDRSIAYATELGLPVAVHTGYWGDFRKLSPLHLIPLLERHPDARFDIFHLGYPWVRETLMLAKGFPNAWINMCWTHAISQRMATDALDEALDLLPTNKVLGFGADYGRPVEKVYGHLVLAREDIARPLARRIAEGRMSEAQALDIAHQWLFDNGAALYGLRV